MNIKKYKDKKGNTRYKFNVYLGKNKITGKDMRTNRQGFKTKKDAEIAYLQLKHKGAEENKKITYIAMYNRWLSLYKETVKRSTLRLTVARFENKILPTLKDYYIDKISVDLIQELVANWKKETGSFKAVLNHCSSIFEYAIKLDYLDKNPCKNVILPAKEKTVKKVSFYDKEELKEFLKLGKMHLQKKWYTFFFLLAFTGMRKSEALALNWEDIEDSKITVNKTLATDDSIYVSSTKTSKSNRKINIDSNTVKVLESFKPKTKQKGAIFVKGNGGYIPLSYPNEILVTFFNKTKLKKITPHGFRHTHCSLLFESGASIKEVQARLGHSDIKTTMNIYAHVSKNKSEEVADKFSEFIWS